MAYTNQGPQNQAQYIPAKEINDSQTPADQLGGTSLDEGKPVPPETSPLIPGGGNLDSKKRPQGESPNPVFRYDPEIEKEAIRILERETYQHYVD